MPSSLRVLVAGCAGVLLVLAFPPVGAWPLAPLAIALCTAMLWQARPGAGALIGIAFGLGFFLPLLHWSGTYVGAFPWLLLAGSQAVPVAVFGALAGPLSRLTGWPVWIAALWVGQEAVRSRLPFGGFPWGRLAFSQPDAPAAALASLGGAPLVSFAVALTGTLLAYTAIELTRRRGRPSAASAFALLATIMVALAGLAVPPPKPSGPSVTVAVVQGNVPRLGLDFNAQREAVLRNHVEATLQLADRVRAGTMARPDLVVWPENSSDIDPLDDPSATALIDRAVRAIRVPVLVGAVLDGPGRYLSNAGIVWDPTSGAGERYIKRHPVPFGEYIPLRPIARRLSSYVDRVARDFTSGHRPGLLVVGPAKVGDVICFEIAYDGVVRDTVRHGADLLVVQTNNATFGRSGETEQQLAMARLRAREYGRAVLVASTSGISAVITPHGRVAERSRVFTRDVLVQSVPLATGRTLATRTGALVEWLIVAVGMAAVAWVVVAGTARRRHE